MQQKVTVLGLGVSGKASARFLLSQGAQVRGADQRIESLSVDPEILELGIELVSDREPLGDVDLLVVSPGITLSHPLVLEAAQRELEVIGEIELALRHIRNRCIAITGTNGKTTTALLTAHLLNKEGIRARVLGNIGASLSEYLLHPDPDEILVLELSSFQLETLKTARFEAGMILNLTPNHLNWHSSMEAYVAAKMRMEKCLVEGGTLFVSKQVATDYGNLLHSFTIFDEESIALNSDVSYIMKGLPERQNIQAALAMCRHFGISEKVSLKNMESFQKPPHRIEWVAEVNGVSYFNDSKASNVHAVMHAVDLFEAPLILIAGGVHKGSSYACWKIPFQSKVMKVIAFGEASEQMEKELSSYFPFTRTANLEEAVLEAKKEAKEHDVVLLSPGCSSYDQFQNFEHRGDEFKRIVRGLK